MFQIYFTGQVLYDFTVFFDKRNNGSPAKLNPRLKVIYASGYSADIADANLTLHDGVNFLAKPFDAHKLVQTVRKMLDS